ncbi:hypothetical protein BDC45DRAFT_565584 [Circinella umbellata]|nr:hypothetical protein BDC45DRAFT_565584 [Circinella umbellata]
MRPLTKKQKRARKQLKNSNNGRFKKRAHREENNVTEISNNSEIPPEDDFQILMTLEVDEEPELADIIVEDPKPIFLIKWDKKTPFPLMSIQEAYDQLTPIVAPIMNTKDDNERSIGDYQPWKHIAVHIYFGELLKKTPIMKALQIAAKTA